jgi:hypothetical protein
MTRIRMVLLAATLLVGLGTAAAAQCWSCVQQGANYSCVRSWGPGWDSCDTQILGAGSPCQVSGQCLDMRSASVGLLAADGSVMRAPSTANVIVLAKFPRDVEHERGCGGIVVARHYRPGEAIELRKRARTLLL